MLSCHGCKRFVREDDARCPFCGTLRETAVAPVVLTIAIGVALAACGPSVAVGDGDAGGETSTSVNESSGTSPSTTSADTTSTTVATTIDPDTGAATTSSSDDDVVDDEGGAFYGGPPDGGGVNVECDVWAQDCEIGNKCMPWNDQGTQGWNATKCSPLDANGGAPGDPCTVEGGPFSGIDSCSLGTMCWDVDPATNQGTCVANCDGNEASPECPDPSTHCLIEYLGTIHVCIPWCDPLLQDCVGSSTCVPVDDEFFCVPDGSGALGQYGDACTSFDGCDPGLFCADATTLPDCASAACCSEFCDTGAPDPDSQCSGVDQGAQCLPWFLVGTAQWEFVGGCRLPS